jgi:hypothetical protein
LNPFNCKNRVKSPPDLSKRQVRIYAGNLETLDVFYKLWRSVFGENSDQWPGGVNNPSNADQIPFVINFKGALTGVVGPYNWAIYTRRWRCW